MEKRVDKYASQSNKGETGRVMNMDSVECSLAVEECGDGIELWTLNDPKEGNQVSDSTMVDAIVDNVDRVSRDNEVKCVVLTGAGSVFSAGGNIKEMRDKTGMFSGDVDDIARGYRDGIQRVPIALSKTTVPFVAAVNGPAVGAGMDLALMCDLRVAAEGAWFAASFVQLGLVPGDGGAWVLPRIVGRAQALEALHK
ncbi:enoyl-CoA hydratase-related protein [Brevibacterium sandarakinum]|nr:enoyl-CoA hydratase-related protein [Brevibacterium sandarakinum]